MSILAKSKAHTRYKLADGTQVPGSTTITGILAKPALIPWANRLGLQGIDSTKYRDEAGIIGTLAHYLIQCHIQKTEPDLSGYAPDQIDAAENAVISYYEWEGQRNVTPILCEVPLVSEVYRYGGTIDLYAEIDGQHWLVDFKTGKALYPEMRYQVAAYEQLLIEHDYPVDGVRILRIGRDENEGFDDAVLRNRDDDWAIFYHCLRIYELRRGSK